MRGPLLCFEGSAEEDVRRNAKGRQTERKGRTIHDTEKRVSMKLTNRERDKITNKKSYIMKKNKEQIAGRASEIKDQPSAEKAEETDSKL